MSKNQKSHGGLKKLAAFLSNGASSSAAAAASIDDDDVDDDDDGAGDKPAASLDSKGVLAAAQADIEAAVAEANDRWAKVMGSDIGREHPDAAAELLQDKDMASVSADKVISILEKANGRSDKPGASGADHEQSAGARRKQLSNAQDARPDTGRGASAGKESDEDVTAKADRKKERAEMRERRNKRVEARGGRKIDA